MCIIIASETGAHADLEMLKTAFHTNGDGAGFAMVQRGRVITFKPFWTFASFQSAWIRERKQYPMSPYIVHFRISTHGQKDARCTHPHVVNKDLVFAHNGILSAFADPTSKVSDTVMFTRTVLQKLPAGFLDDPAHRGLLNAATGHANKFAFLRSDGSLYTFGVGVQDKMHPGIWFSNDTYETPRVYAWDYRDYSYRDKWSDKWSPHTRNTQRGTLVAQCEECGIILDTEQMKWSPQETCLCPDCAEEWLGVLR